jgi:hypothetical protein
VGANIGGTKVEQITPIVPNERVRLNSECLETLYRRLGEEHADDVLCRAMEEMAIRMKQCEKLYGAGLTKDLRKLVHSLVAIADQIGMATLARVAEDVVACLDREDWVALGATFARLIRSGDQSLTAIWDLQDLSV